MNKYSKKRLMEVLLNFYKNNQTDQLNIKEITHQAGITRMTFYRHFKDLKDLQRWVAEELLLDSLRFLMAGNTLRQGLFARLNQLRKSDFYFLGIKDEVEFSSFSTVQMESLYFFNMLRAKNVDSSMDLMKCISAGWEYLISEWINDGMNRPIDSLVQSMLESVPDSIKEPIMSMHENVAVSGCLLGELCKYDGTHNCKEWVVSLKDKKNLISICPEMMGGLPCPRPCSEVRHYRVINVEGKDVTVQFQMGAETAFKKVMENRCTLAVLKAKSPSCGIHEIYDGTFTHTLIHSSGITARLLICNNIPVIHENELREVLKAPI